MSEENGIRVVMSEENEKQVVMSDVLCRADHAARKGDAAAQLNLGEMFEKGCGTPRHLVSAYMWFSFAASNKDETCRVAAERGKERLEKSLRADEIEKAKEDIATGLATETRTNKDLRNCKRLTDKEKKERFTLEDLAEEGYAVAQSTLASMFFHGTNGRPQNYRRAYKLHALAARQGNVQGQDGLAYLHLHGLGTTQNYEKAVALFRASAKRGSAYAQFHLGALFNAGEGVGKDLIESYRWLCRASLGGNKEYVELRNEVREKLSAANLKEAQTQEAEDAHL